MWIFLPYSEFSGLMLLKLASWEIYTMELENATDQGPTQLSQSLVHVCIGMTESQYHC